MDPPSLSCISEYTLVIDSIQNFCDINKCTGRNSKKEGCSFSVETSGVLDMDSELEMYFCGLGFVKFEFTENSMITGYFFYTKRYFLSLVST